MTKYTQSLVSAAAFAALVFAAASGDGQAAVLYGNHRYSLTTTSGTWSEAEAEAVAAGGHLVAINSPGEQAFLESAAGFNIPGSSFYYHWIGLSDAASEGTWTWSNGDPTTFFNWATFESFGGMAENYVFMNFENNARHGQWHDVSHERDHYGIIEFVPVGGASAMFLMAGLGLLLALRRVGGFRDWVSRSLSEPGRLREGDPWISAGWPISLIAGATLVPACTLRAVEYVTPLSYSVVGTVNSGYPDETGRSLIDGILAPTAEFWKNPADNAYVGYFFPLWITFNFGEKVYLDKVELDITAHSGMKVPDLTIGELYYNLPDDAIAPNERGWVGVDKFLSLGSSPPPADFWSGESLTVGLVGWPHFNMVFADEFRFQKSDYLTPAVPDSGPSSTFTFLAFSSLCLFGRRIATP